MTGKWLKSKARTWHLYGGTVNEKPVAACQSYNLDRPIYLTGEAVQLLPAGARFCKKCASHVEKCHACGSPSLQKSGACKVCADCGETTGCS